MKLTAVLFIIIPFCMVGQTNTATLINEGYPPDETMAFIEQIDSLESVSKRYHRENINASKDTINYAQLCITKLTDDKTYFFLKSQEFTTRERLDYILTFNRYLTGLFIYLYRDYTVDRYDNILKVFHSLVQTNIAQYSLLEEMLLKKEIEEATFQMEYMHPVLQNTFLVLEIENNPRKKTLLDIENLSHDICAMSEKYFAFYRRYKTKLVDKDWLESYNWKQKNISIKHWSKCVQKSALKNL